MMLLKHHWHSQGQQLNHHSLLKPVMQAPQREFYVTPDRCARAMMGAEPRRAALTGGVYSWAWAMSWVSSTGSAQYGQAQRAALPHGQVWWAGMSNGQVRRVVHLQWRHIFMPTSFIGCWLLQNGALPEDRGGHRNHHRGQNYPGGRLLLGISSAFIQASGPKPVPFSWSTPCRTKQEKCNERYCRQL